MVNFADANRAKIKYVLETSFGTTPVGPSMKEVRLTGESLSHNKTTVLSEELRSDRQRSSLIETAANAGGDVSIELSHNTYDDFIEAALQGTFVTVSTVVSAVFTASTIAVGSTVAAALEVGQFFRVSGAGSNNGIMRVASKTPTVITVEGGTFAVATTVASTVIRGKTVTNGTTKRSFTIEREYEDLGMFFQATGMNINTMAMTIASNAIATGSFSFIGKEGFFSSTTVASAVVAAPTTDVLNSTRNVGSIYESDFSATLVTALRQITLNINNNLREQQAVGSRTAVGIGNGSVEVTGQLDAYFNNIVLAKKFVDHTESLLSFRFTDAAGNVNVITLDRVFFSNGNAPAAGLNQDIISTMEFSAIRDPVTGKTIRWDVLDA